MKFKFLIGAFGMASALSAYAANPFSPFIGAREAAFIGIFPMVPVHAFPRISTYDSQLYEI